METLTVLEAIAQLKTTGSSDTRIIKKHIVGKVFRQGDVYVHFVANNHPVGEIIKTRQLVKGNTQGCRHILDGDVTVFEGIALPKWVNPAFKNIALGPAFRVNSAATLTHPEHAHVELPPGLCQTTYQIDIRSMKRILD